MTRRLKIFMSMVIMLLLASCASIKRRTEQAGHFRESSLTNLNPAPDAFQPPAIGNSENSSANNAYLQSQSDYHFTLGESLAFEGNSERAIEEFKLTLVYDPKSVMVRLRLAMEYIRQGLLSEAIEQAEMAVQLDNHSTEGHLLLGGLFSSLKMYEEALEQYRFILSYSKDNQDARIYIGAILAEQKKYDEAVAAFEELEPYFDKGEKYKAFYYIGRVRAEQGGPKNWTLAEKAFSKALERNSSDVESVLALVKVYERQGKDGSSLKLLESFQEKAGPDLRVAQHLSNIYLEKEMFEKAIKQLEYVEGFEPDDIAVKFRLGLLYVEKKDYESAIVKFEGILKLEPQSDRPRFYLGAVYEELKRYDQAIEQFLKIAPSSGFYADAVIHAAYLNKLQTHFDRAIEIVEEAIEKRDDIPQFYAFYASLLDDKKAYQKGISMLTKAVERFPTQTQLLFFLGSMQERAGNSKATIENMEKVIELDPNHVQALNFLAYTYAELNENLGVAEELARRALSFQPKDGYILDTLGWILYKQNKIPEAIKQLELAYKLKSTEGIIAEHLGDAYYRHELVEKARKMYERAIEVETDGEKIDKIRKKIVAIDNKIDTLLREERRPASTAEPQ